METILIYVTLGLILVSLAMMVVFGLRNAGTFLQQGKLALAAFALPVVIFVIAYLVDGTWTGAAVATALFTALSGFAALVISGVKSLIS